MNENHEPTLGLAVLHHIEKVVDDRIKQAIKSHELENEHWKKDTDKRLVELNARINSGFPHDDPLGHRRVHEQYIEEAEDKRETKNAAKSHIINAGVLAFAVLLCNALWDYIKANLK